MPEFQLSNAARCHANWHHVACCSPPRSPFDPGRHDVGSSRLHVPKVSRSASDICSPPPEPVEYAGNEYAALPVRHVFLCCAIYLADPPGHLRFGTDRCVYIQLITGFDRYSQRGWPFKGVGTLVAAEIEVGPSTGDTVDVLDAKPLLRVSLPGLPLPRRGTDTPTKPETDHQAGFISNGVSQDVKMRLLLAFCPEESDGSADANKPAPRSPRPGGAPPRSRE